MSSVLQRPTTGEEPGLRAEPSREGGVDLSVVIPIFNEEATLPELYRRLSQVLARDLEGLTYEIVFVNDGSGDGSLETLAGLHEADAAVKVVGLSRNFGHQMAITAGIDHARGRAVLLMDGDLQDPPEFVPRLVAEWQRGFDVAYAVRIRRKEGFFKRFAFKSFYRLLQRLSDTPVPLDAGIFSVMDRRVADALRSMPERSRYLSGLRAWAGFRQIGVPCERDARFEGDPRQTLTRLFKLAFDGLFAFSYIPLRVATLTGLIVSAVSFLIGLRTLYLKLFTDSAILGWASLLVATTFLGGLILLMLGVVGEYIARIYDEVKQRPRYLVSRRLGL